MWPTPECNLLAALLVEGEAERDPRRLVFVAYTINSLKVLLLPRAPRGSNDDLHER